MERLYKLFIQKYGVSPESMEPITGSASPRRYFRMSAGQDSCVGVLGVDSAENQAFIGISCHFRNRGLPVPEVYAVSEDKKAYIQEDLGDDILFDMYSRAKRRGEGMEEVESLLCRTMAMLPKMQFDGADGLDFNICYPQSSFDKRMVLFDLNYFKYCFLKATGLEFNEMLLQDDFESLADELTGCGLPVAGKATDVSTFLYRDFQARNVMVRDGQPYFIDFQGGRRGPIYYDVASFIWHARADYDPQLRSRMLDSYLSALSEYIDVDRDIFIGNLRLFRLYRYLQVLGAYGFRGWTEHKAAFVVSIPEAMKALGELIEKPFDNYPYLDAVLRQMIALERFTPQPRQNGLTVTIYSFSFKKGVPYDPSGNGGGYVFDCRSIHNPGKYEQYKKLTGRDEEVVRFLEDDGEVFGFLEHVYGVVDPHVETYFGRGFTDLMVSFGCTGGQHRSVYCAESLARHIVQKYPHVRVRLIHREQNITETFGGSHDA